MDSIANARISTALTQHRDLVPQTRNDEPATEPEAAREEAGAAEADREGNLEESARREKDEYRERLRQDNELNRDFAQAMHKLNERPILLPQTLQETDQQVHQEDLDTSLEKEQLQGRLDLARRQMEEASLQADDPHATWEARRQMLLRSRGVIDDGLSNLGSLRERYYEKFQEFAGKDDGMKARLEMEERMARLDSQRDFLENYYQLLGSVAGRGEGRNNLVSMAHQAEGIDPGMAHHPDELARRQRREAA